jgi:hypothetical protein
MFELNPAPSPRWVVVGVDDVGLVVTLPTPDSPGFTSYAVVINSQGVGFEISPLSGPDSPKQIE